MRCSTTVARQLARAAGPIASTSRPLLRATVAPAAARLRVPTRSVVTIPNPALDSSNGDVHFVVRNFNSTIPSVVHVLAILRAVEERLGPVISFTAPKDEDSRKPTSTIFITTLRPVKLDEPLVVEIPSPVLSRVSTFTGGPAFGDVEDVLGNAPVTAPKTRDAKTLQFSVEARKNAPPPVRAHTQRVNPTKSETKEDDAIVRALAAFEGGFNGGLAGIADKFKSLEIEPEILVEEAKPEVVEEVVQEAAEVTQVVAELVAEPVAPAPTPKPTKAARPTLSRAEKLRIKAMGAARASAAHQKAFEESAAAAAAAAATAAAAETAKAEQPQGAVEEKQGGLFGGLFGSKP